MNISVTIAAKNLRSSFSQQVRVLKMFPVQIVKAIMLRRSFHYAVREAAHPRKLGMFQPEAGAHLKAALHEDSKE